MDMPLDVAEMNEQNMSDFGSLGMSGFVPALEKGAALGGVLGLLGGLAALAFPPTGFILGGIGLFLKSLRKQ